MSRTPKSAGAFKAEVVVRSARERFGWEALRPGQLEAIQAVLEGHDVLVVMPTGAGKSAVYQVSALLVDGPTVVVSPLIALQRDQLLSLLHVEGGAPRAVDSETSRMQQDEAFEALRTGEIEFIFVTPEQLQRPEVVEAVQQAEPSLFVVDEAHCVSDWGHDFRPDYQRLGPVIEQLGRPRIVALTATAAPPVRDEILTSLGMTDPKVFVRGFDRPNIDLQVERHLEDAAKREAVLLRAAAEPKPGLVYTGTRKDAERYAGELSDVGLRASAYHAGMGKRRRQEIHDAFLAGELDVVVATTAFGMGIDKPDVRFVIHAHVAESPDSYYQEIGRAGRDGEPAAAVLFYREEDLGLRRFFAAGIPKEEDVRRIVSLLYNVHRPVSRAELVLESGFGATKVTRLANLLEQVGAVTTVEGNGFARADGAPEPAVATQDAIEKARSREAIQRSRVEMMRGYAETTGCRREYLLGYLGEQIDAPCGRCDNCCAGLVEPTDTEAEQDGQPFAINTTVSHTEWGRGTVMSLDGLGPDDDPATVTVLFESVGYKTLGLDLVQEGNLLRRAD